MDEGFHGYAGILEPARETDAVFSKDGWLRTGDVAYMDEDGYFFIVDRIKDMICGGFNIYPRDVDEVLLKHPAVMDAITILPRQYRGEIKAFQLKPGATATEEELMHTLVNLSI